MITRVRHRCLVALLACASACASQAGAPAAGSATTERSTKNPNVISSEELKDPNIVGIDAHTAVRQLRPAFLRTQGPQSISNESTGQVQVSQDYGALQQLANLAAIPVRDLVEIRYLNAVEAQQRFGISARSGPVIVVLTQRH